MEELKRAILELEDTAQSLNRALITFLCNTDAEPATREQATEIIEALNKAYVMRNAPIENIYSFLEKQPLEYDVLLDIMKEYLIFTNDTKDQKSYCVACFEVSEDVIQQVSKIKNKLAA